MPSIKQAVINAARYTNPEEEDRGLRLEHLLGMGTAGATMLPLLTNRPMMDVSKAKRMSALGMYRNSRPGDILVAHNKAPYSAWRALAPALGGSPYYHADIIGRGGEAHMAGSSTWLNNAVRDQQSAILLRPKNLTAAQRKAIARNAGRLTNEPYSFKKLLGTGITRAVVPPGINPPRCSGNICSTGPADVLRKSRVSPGLNAPKGYELASDYLRSDRYEPVGIYGTKYNLKNWDHVYGPAMRTAMAAALGGSVYKATKDIREGEGLAPLAGVLGGLGGLYAGQRVEGMGYTPVKDVRKNWVGGQWLTATPERTRRLRSIQHTVANKASLTPSAALGGIGSLGAYGLAKHIYARQRRRREEEAKRLASRSYGLSQ